MRPVNLFELLADPTFQTVCLGTSLIGAISGSLGCFAYLRKQSLVGDVISHSSLFGVVLFFLASYLLWGQPTKSLFLLIPGAIFSGVISLWLNQWLLANTSIRVDSALGVMLSIFFGAGVFLLRWLQRWSPPIAGHRGLESYFFGQAAAMTSDDLWMIIVMGFISLGLVTVFFKELKLYTLDPNLARNLGFGATWLESLLVVLIVLGIVVGIQTIGVILMIAMLVTPPAAARQWVSSLRSMVFVAAAIGLASGFMGCLVSALFDNMPTGPVVVLNCIVLFGLSLLFAPHRGIVSSLILQNRTAGLGQTVRQHDYAVDCLDGFDRSVHRISLCSMRSFSCGQTRGLHF